MKMAGAVRTAGKGRIRRSEMRFFLVSPKDVFFFF